MGEQETKTSEQALVIPQSVVEACAIADGFSDRGEGLVPTLLLHGEFRPRGPELESDETVRQIIPYIVLTHLPADGRLHVYAYRRTPAAGESRLHGKRSIGLGGHVNSVDGLAPLDAYQAGLLRELAEEVEISPANGTTFTTFVGVIRDDSNPVGRVHLGFVEHVNLTDPVVQSKEADHADDGLHPLVDLLNDIDSFEPWSQLLLRSSLALNALNVPAPTA